MAQKMIEQELISVIMPAFNAEKYIRTAINSILSQTYTNFEFLICDDASTDGTLDIINEYDDARIRIIRHTVNKGIVTTLNELIELSSGSLIARMDADDISLPKRFQVQHDFLMKNSTIGLVGTGYVIINASQDLLKIGPIIIHDSDIKNELLFRNSFIHGSVMFRKKIIKGFEYQKKAVYSEDYDLWLRLSKTTNFANIPEILYLWMKNPNGSTSIFKNEMKVSANDLKRNNKFSEKERLSQIDAETMIDRFNEYSLNKYVYCGINYSKSLTKNYQFFLIKLSFMCFKYKMIKKSLKILLVSLTVSPFNILSIFFEHILFTIGYK